MGRMGGGGGFPAGGAVAVLEPPQRQVRFEADGSAKATAFKGRVGSHDYA